MPCVPKQRALQHRIECWKYRQQGWTYEEIAKKVGLTFNGVATILYRESKKYGQRHTEDVSRVKNEQVAQLEHISSEAMQAWERSKQAAKKMRETKVKNSQSGSLVGNITQTNEAQEQEGDPRYLLVCLKAKEDIRKIIGADAPTKSIIDSTVQYENLTDAQLFAKANELIERARAQRIIEHDSSDGENAQSMATITGPTV